MHLFVLIYLDWNIILWISASSSSFFFFQGGRGDWFIGQFYITQPTETEFGGYVEDEMYRKLKSWSLLSTNLWSELNAGSLVHTQK